MGEKQFELSNHLGNVLATITDNIGMNTADSVWATVLSTRDYYPFGLEMEGRVWSDTTSSYRYGFNGKEKDDNGEWGDVAYDYGFRIYDPVIARFKSVDPLTMSYPWYTPYQFAGNTPIWAIDLDGLEEQKTNSGPTPFEAALISDHVYNVKGGKELLNGVTNQVGNSGWQLSDRKVDGVEWENSKTGFRSALYERTVDGVTDYVYATAGTNDVKDVNTDIRQVLGLAEKQYPQSIKNARIIYDELVLGSNQNISFTGHSLGGGQAAANALATGLDAITFNAAALSGFTKGRHNLVRNAKIDNYFIFGEWVTERQQSIMKLTAEGNPIGLAPPRDYGYRIHDGGISQPGFLERMSRTIDRLISTAPNEATSIRNHMMKQVITSLKEAKIE